MNSNNHTAQVRPFSLKLYILIVFSLSWPFQIAFVYWGDDPWLRYSLSSASMMMVAVGTFIAGRYIFRDGFRNAGWNWGKPRHYFTVLGLALLIWVIPTAIELVLGMRSWPADLLLSQIILGFSTRFVGTLLPGFGEEFGWRGYMLQRISRRHSVRRAVGWHSVIWWAWHLPALVGIGMRAETIAGGLVLAIAGVLVISFIPAVMHGVVFAYIWTQSQSLAVATVYHAAYDEIRDTLDATVGLDSLSDLWSNIILTLLGAVLLWKGNWKNLESVQASGVTQAI